MRIAIVTVLALTACGTDPDAETLIPGPAVVTTLCAAGCNAGVEMAVVSSKWIQLNDDIYEYAGELEATPTSDATHGTFENLVADPCGGVAYSGSCAETCTVSGPVVGGAGASCVAIACPTEVVIARCDL